MRVMVTGATGFVGGHVTRAAVAAGHQVTALVRNPQRLTESMAALGTSVPDYVEGDMLNPDTVGAALDGAEAVIHCAALVSIDKGNEAAMMSGNIAGARNVLGQAFAARLDPIVHVSSTSALFRPGAGPLTTEHPPAGSGLAYGASKSQCEVLARDLQADGGPVVIVYPAGILGPAAGTALGETASGMARFVAGGIVPTRSGSVSVIDVRDLAEVIVAQLVEGQGPRRVMCGGHQLDMATIGTIFRQLTGRRFPVLPVPPSALRTTGRLLDAAQRIRPFETSISHEAMTLATQWEGTLDSDLASFGVELRDPFTTFADSMPYWQATGLINSRQLGSAGA